MDDFTGLSESAWKNPVQVGRKPGNGSFDDVSIETVDLG
jgi:hypothetical protein